MTDLLQVVRVFAADDHGRVLQCWHPTYGWLLPGGKVDPGETPLMAAHRELYEETGLGYAGDLIQVPSHILNRAYEVHVFLVFEPSRLYGRTLTPEAHYDGSIREARWASMHYLSWFAHESIARVLAHFAGVRP